MAPRNSFSTQGRYQQSKLNLSLYCYRSIEIHNIPYNKKSDQVIWHRFYVYQMQEEIQIMIEGLDDPHF